jgi:ferredoxin-type protein NapG
MSNTPNPMDRRRFFRAGLRELLKPLASGIDNIERVTQHLGALDAPKPTQSYSPPTPHLEHWLRPPGALEEKAFRETCSRCGICASVCPADAIKIDTTGLKGHGAPYINIEEMPCVVCDGTPCMHNCPSGALLPVPIGDIDMGTAVWDESMCLRTRDDSCKICVDQCPLGSAAIETEGNRIRVHESACIGCGVCEHYCPTVPKSITIIPRAARDS